MAKVINITDKLDFDGRPSVVIGEKTYILNDDAKTVVTILGMTKEMNLQNDPEAVLAMAKLMFREEDFTELYGSMNFRNFMIVIEAAMSAVTDTDAEGGDGFRV